jgi:hypothetical protein
MSKYGDAALYARKLFVSREVKSLDEAWTKAMKKFFPSSPSSQKKGCPKDTFLGLCEEGLIKNIPSGQYTKSDKNKHYAVVAIRLLKRKPKLADDKNSLWEKLVQGRKIAHNSQMDVVIALWKDARINL